MVRMIPGSVVLNSQVPRGIPTAIPIPSPAIGRQRISFRDLQVTKSSAGRLTSSKSTTTSLISGKTRARLPTAINPAPKPNIT